MKIIRIKEALLRAQRVETRNLNLEYLLRSEWFWGHNLKLRLFYVLIEIFQMLTYTLKMLGS